MGGIDEEMQMFVLLFQRYEYVEFIFYQHTLFIIINL